MTSRTALRKELKGAAKELTPFEKALLSAMAQDPLRSPESLSRITGVSTGCAMRNRRRLREEGVWAPGYDLNPSHVDLGPLAACWARLAPGASLDRFAPLLANALREAAVTGLFMLEGEVVVGLISGAGLDALARLEGVLHAADREVVHLEFAPFGRTPGFAFVPIDYRGVIGRVPRPAAARTSTGQGRRGALEAAQLRRRLKPTEVAVGRDLLLHGGATVDEGAERLGISRSSFAHSKSSLLQAGVLRPCVRLHLPAIGFRFLLVTTRHHRPIRGHLAHAKTLNVGVSAPPLSLLLSPTRGFVVRPYRDLESAREQDRRFLAESQALDLAGPPRSAIFSFAGLRLVVHCAAGGLQDGWIAGLGSTPMPTESG